MKAQQKQYLIDKYIADESPHPYLFFDVCNNHFIDPIYIKQLELLSDIEHRIYYGG
ncbi:MAG: conserved hypothetical protein [Methanobrevibacter sp. CfCl-M3]